MARVTRFDFSDRAAASRGSIRCLGALLGVARVLAEQDQVVGKSHAASAGPATNTGVIWPLAGAPSAWPISMPAQTDGTGLTLAYTR